MPFPPGWSALLLLCLCRPQPADPGADASKENAKAPARILWEKGQHELAEGRTAEAVSSFRASLRLDPAESRNHLSLAAAYLAQDSGGLAVSQLAEYLAAEPRHLAVRAHYAELLLKLDRTAEAREQFERFAADAQEYPARAEEQLVHCHSRLMEVAEAEGDDYAEHLHRGIGLYLLAKQRAALADPEGELPAEALLFRAAGELAQARKRKPDEARPCWYLHEVWKRLAQPQPAARWLRAAESAAPFSHLTSAERRGLQLACRESGPDSRHR